MAGRPPEVDHVKATFLKELNAAEDLVSSIRAMPVAVHPNAPPGLHPKHVRQVIELAFMGAVAAWEGFLEGTLVRYVAGAKTSGGYAPTPKVGKAVSMTHAYQVLSKDANFKRETGFLKVTEPNWVVATADFLFSSHGYGSLTANRALLVHAASIRNRVAHSSDKCRAEFKKTTLAFLSPSSGKLTQGYAPGDLLMAKASRIFEHRFLSKGGNHFDAYLRLFKHLASQVVP